MNVYAFYDFGLSAKPQCIIEAPHVEAAQQQLAAKCFQVHRMTARIGVRLVVQRSAEGTWALGPFAHTRKEVLAQAKRMTFESPASWYYGFASTPLYLSSDETRLLEPIADIQAEFAKYGL